MCSDSYQSNMAALEHLNIILCVKLIMSTILPGPWSCTASAQTAVRRADQAAGSAQSGTFNRLMLLVVSNLVNSLHYETLAKRDGK